MPPEDCNVNTSTTSSAKLNNSSEDIEIIDVEDGTFLKKENKFTNNISDNEN